MVEVDLVGRAVPGVVRPAVDVEQERLRPGRVRVADEPAVDDGAVGDRELALLAREALDLREGGAVVGQDRLVARGEVDEDDLAVRARGGEPDGHRSARDGQAADDPGRARHDRARLPAVERDRVQVRAPAVADAEDHRAAVAGELRRAARICGRAGHHVAVERGGQVDRLAAVERQPQQARVADRAVEVPGDDERRPVRRPCDRAADAVLEPDRLRSRALRRVDDVDRRAEGEVGVRRRRGGERQPRPVRRPRGVAGVPVAVGQPAAVLRLEVDDVQVLAQPAQEARAVGLVVEPVGDDRRLGLDARGRFRPRPARRRGRRAPRTRSRCRRGSRPARRRRAAASSAAPPHRRRPGAATPAAARPGRAGTRAATRPATTRARSPRARA